MTNHLEGKESSRVITTKKEQCRIAYLLHQVTDIKFSELLKKIEEQGIKEVLNNPKDFSEDQKQKLQDIGEMLKILGGEE